MSEPLLACSLQPQSHPRTTTLESNTQLYSKDTQLTITHIINTNNLTLQQSLKLGLSLTQSVSWASLLKAQKGGRQSGQSRVIQPSTGMRLSLTRRVLQIESSRESFSKISHQQTDSSPTARIMRNHRGGRASGLPPTSPLTVRRL